MLQHGAGAGQNGFAGTARFGGRVNADDQHAARAAKPVHRGGRHLVVRTGRKAHSAGHTHTLGAELLDAHLPEITTHIGQQISTRVADFIKQLLGHGGAQNLAAGARGFMQFKAAIGKAIDDRVADIWPIGNVLPIGVQAPRGLAAAFNDVPGQTAAGEQVVILWAPIKFVHQRPQRHGTVHPASGDHNVCPFGQRTGHRHCAQIGIGRQHLGGQGIAAVHVAGVRIAQGGQLRADVVAEHHRNFWAQAHAVGQGLQRIGAALWVHAARVGDDLDAALHHLGQGGFHRHVDKVGGVAHVWFFGAHRGHDGHGGLGQVVKYKVVNQARLHKLGCAQHAVAPKTGGAANADRAAGRRIKVDRGHGAR